MSQKDDELNPFWIEKGFDNAVNGASSPMGSLEYLIFGSDENYRSATEGYKEGLGAKAIIDAIKEGKDK